MGDFPVGVLLYNPGQDRDGAELRRARELYPEAQIFGWPRGAGASEDLPPGMQRWPEDSPFLI
jgi:hypothetical protein